MRFVVLFLCACGPLSAADKLEVLPQGLDIAMADDAAQPATVDAAIAPAVDLSMPVDMASAPADLATCVAEFSPCTKSTVCCTHVGIPAGSSNIYASCNLAAGVNICETTWDRYDCTSVPGGRRTCYSSPQGDICQSC